MYMQPSQDDIASVYDAVPYESYPFIQSHPEHLYAMARLFKLSPKPVEECRVLELGCAGGGNIIPHAVRYPNSSFLGIDISQKEIEMGQKYIDALQLKNISLREMSLTDLSLEDGLFDYIICHGVFSWVDPETREKILSICKENLSTDGVAYISYNTLPGWNMLNSIRDLMLWHTQAIEDPKKKVTQSRMIMKFITEGLGEGSSPFATFLRQELEGLSKQADNYILHEHLSYYNEPLYFFQFMEQAKKHELSYLADANLSTMFAGNLPPKFSKELGKIKNIIAANQYMDFVRNNRFRCTLLCHQDRVIDRKLEVDDVKEYYLQLKSCTTDIEPTEEMINTEEPLKFTFSGATINSKNKHYKALFYILYQNRYNVLHYNEIKSKLANYVELDDEALDKFLLHDVNIMRMILAGMIKFSYNPPLFTTNISPMPTVCPLARYQALTQMFVTNRMHHVTQLDPFSKAIIPLLDGQHTHKQVIEEMTKKVEKEELSVVDKDKKPITDEALRKKVIEDMFNKLLIKISHSALLIS